MSGKQPGGRPAESNPNNLLTRRDFLKGAGATAGGYVWRKIIPFAELVESLEIQSLSRKEHFKPFNRGYAEWQYVEFLISKSKG